MRILITRPIEDAKPLADALAERGIDVLIEPLLEIRHAGGCRDRSRRRAGAAVHQRQWRARLRRLSPRRDLKVFTVGDGSADAARAGRLSRRRERHGRCRGAGRPGGGPPEGRRTESCSTPPARSRPAISRRRLGGARLPRAPGAALRGQDRHRPVARDPRQSDAGRRRRGPVVLAAHRRAPSPNCGARPARRPWRSIQALCLSAAVAREIGTSGLGGGRDRRPAGLAFHAGPGGCCPQQRSRHGRAIPAPRRSGGRAARRRGRPDSAASGAEIAGAAAGTRPRAGSEPAAAPCCSISTLMLIAAAAVVVTAPLWQPQVSAMLGLGKLRARHRQPDRRAARRRPGLVRTGAGGGRCRCACNEAIGAAIDPVNADLGTLKQELAALKSELESRCAAARLPAARHPVRRARRRSRADRGAARASWKPRSATPPGASTRSRALRHAAGLPDAATAAPPRARSPRRTLASENEALRQQIAS